MVRDTPLLKRVQKVTIEPHLTLFWRYQNLSVNYLSTIEAIYYLYMEYAEQFEGGILTKEGNTKTRHSVIDTKKTILNKSGRFFFCLLFTDLCTYCKLFHKQFHLQPISFFIPDNNRLGRKSSAVLTMGLIERSRILVILL
ncbi:unnamed protein product [Rhizopus stolonifer]